jgi:hypothetical protein
MNENLEYARIFARFPFALRRFLKKRLTLADAERIMRDRVEHRTDNFLKMLERNVYNNPRSPYLKLLKQAGCELGDVRSLVQQDDIETALKQLRDKGVYVTFEEFKGRKPIVRNGLTIPVQASDFDNPHVKTDLPNETSGSTGAAVKVAIDFDYIAALAPNRMVGRAAHGLLDLPTAYWRGIMPDRTMGRILYGIISNQYPQKWFSPNHWRDSKHAVKYGLGTYYLIGCMRMQGIPIPLPEFVPQEDAVHVARWAVETVKKHGRCMVQAGTSRGVRVCHAAEQAGLDLTGVSFTGAGEPATPGKVEQYKRVGAHFVSNYGMSEAGQPGGGCANGVGISDYHLNKDTHALFAYPHYVEAFDVTVPAFNLTTLLPVSSKVMLNVQTDDFGIVEERRCGCKLESFGFTTHLREIRSYSKLTGEGVTLIGDEMIYILENILPARFGGSPFDYQLMEQEDEQGFTRLYLLIHPRLEITSEAGVIDCVHDALRNSSATGDATRIVWQSAKTLRVKRMEPVWNANGKFSPLYLPKRYNASTMPQGGGNR